ncbi:hypothetical protein [Variovorax sp. OK605]|uniref:hypothetical protein n=1 Tax=Variovorax sp. OK605 TaxID=1855317 RepID=UPI0011603D41|nr:hypothetical protein [Variovorax sp. OK605]
MKSSMTQPSSDPRPPATTRFQLGALSRNPTGRPTKLALALRGLQPLMRLGVLQGELQALAEAQAAGNAQCWGAAMALIAGRLRLDPAVVTAGAQAAGTASITVKGGRGAEIE